MSNTYLIHYGVKGMKWGVRRYQNPDGTLTPAGRSKYYNEKGTINRTGIKAKKKAQSIRDVAKGNTGLQAGLLATRYYLGHDAHKWVQDTLHQQGNKTITQMAKRGSSVGSRKVVAGAYIAAMGAVKVSELYPAAATAYYKTRYKHDDNYRNRIDAAAKMKQRIPKKG